MKPSTPGLNGVPNCLFKAYAGIPACPVTAVLNSSFAEQRRPSSWKMVPVSKLKPVIDINKHLRPISLTSVICKLAKDFVVALHFGHAVLKVSDPNQYGGTPESSSLHALIPMLHTWLQPSDGPGTSVRVELFDYWKVLVFFSFIPSNFGLP